MNGKVLFVMIALTPALVFLYGVIIGVMAEIERPRKAMALGAVATAATYGWIWLCWWLTNGLKFNV
jgi:hypothetical protein